MKLICVSDTHKKEAVGKFKNHYSINNNTGCWVWNKTLSTTGGYAQCNFKYKTWKASRLFYCLYKGDFDSSLLVLHKCDNTKCVNPEHLYLGTQQDNMNDAVFRNRLEDGEDRYNAKLTKSKVSWIRKAYSIYKWTQRKIAKKFGIKQATVWKIIHNERWKA